MKSNLKKITKDIGTSIGGEVAILLTNFILFLYLIKGFSPDEYGAWALYITIIAIINGFRQGFVQNGFIVRYIRENGNKAVVSSAIVLNIALIIVVAALVYLIPYVWTGLTTETKLLLNSGWKTLLSMGFLQFFSSYYLAKKENVLYLWGNLIHLITFLAVLFIWTSTKEIEFINVLDIQLLTIVGPTLFFLFNFRKPKMPRVADMKFMLLFGRFASGTNLGSLLFQKVDILMIGYFLSPTAVALYHLATKVLAYAELPMQAISQIIFPRMVSNIHANGKSQLGQIYSRSVLLLSIFIIPVILVLMLFSEQIILLLSTPEYLDAKPLIFLYAFIMFLKPWGRVFGLSLDALGKPSLNFMVLMIGLIINIVLNLIFINEIGLYGGAMATAIGAIISFIMAQLILNRTERINAIKETYLFVRNLKREGISLS